MSLADAVAEAASASDCRWLAAWGRSAGFDPPALRASQALHIAAACGCPDTVKVLLGLGADADQRDSNNAAPLHIAVVYKHADIVSLLLAHTSGDTLRCRTKQGHGIWDLASNQPDVLAIQPPDNPPASFSQSVRIVVPLIEDLRRQVTAVKACLERQSEESAHWKQQVAQLTAYVRGLARGSAAPDPEAESRAALFLHEAVPVQEHDERWRTDRDRGTMYPLPQPERGGNTFLGTSTLRGSSDAWQHPCRLANTERAELEAELNRIRSARAFLPSPIRDFTLTAPHTPDAAPGLPPQPSPVGPARTVAQGKPRFGSAEPAPGGGAAVSDRAAPPFGSAEPGAGGGAAVSDHADPPDDVPYGSAEPGADDGTAVSDRADRLIATPGYARFGSAEPGAGGGAAVSDSAGPPSGARAAPDCAQYGSAEPGAGGGAAVSDRADHRSGDLEYGPVSTPSRSPTTGTPHASPPSSGAEDANDGAGKHQPRPSATSSSAPSLPKQQPEHQNVVAREAHLNGLSFAGDAALSQPAPAESAKEDASRSRQHPAAPAEPAEARAGGEEADHLHALRSAAISQSTPVRRAEVKRQFKEDSARLESRYQHVLSMDNTVGKQAALLLDKMNAEIEVAERHVRQKPATTPPPGYCSPPADDAPPLEAESGPGPLLSTRLQSSTRQRQQPDPGVCEFQ
ncbi:hypothetical protein DIPPA_22971 [Diplonema papillatum]|nr:hypothetical protein DIPPA_22971 [Diplonema papillatum]